MNCTLRLSLILVLATAASARAPLVVKPFTPAPADPLLGAAPVGISVAAASGSLSIDEVLKLSRLAPTPDAEVKVLIMGVACAHSADEAIRLARATRSDKTSDLILHRAETL